MALSRESCRVCSTGNERENEKESLIELILYRIAELMLRESEISSIHRKPGGFTKNTSISFDRVFDSVARCSHLGRHLIEQQVTKRGRLNSQQRHFRSVRPGNEAEREESRQRAKERKAKIDEKEKKRETRQLKSVAGVPAWPNLVSLRSCISTTV